MPGSLAWLPRNVRQVCQGGLRWPTMYFATVDSETLEPEFRCSGTESLLSRLRAEKQEGNEIFRVWPLPAAAAPAVKETAENSR